MTAEIVSKLLAAKRFTFANEIGLQTQIATALMLAGIPFRREVALSPRDRIDFLVGDPPSFLGIEVKTKSSLADMTRQAHRYLTSASLRELLVVCTVSRLSALPESFNGKPLRVCVLAGSMM